MALVAGIFVVLGMSEVGGVSIVVSSPLIIDLY
jgi:hypothetical protein